MRCVLAAVAFTTMAGPTSAQEVDRTQINRIIDEGFNQSRVMETAAFLADRIGGRMTNSPQMRQAERWTQQRFRDWGLTNVRAEGFAFGPGWSISRSSVRMTAPRMMELRAIPIAWTPPTNGAISAGLVVAPMTNPGDFGKWQGKLEGKIVLVTQPDGGSEPTEPPFIRRTDEELSRLDVYRQPSYSSAAIERSFKEASFSEARDAFLEAEGALAWVRMSVRDGGLVHGEGRQVGRTALLPAIELAAEDYRRLARLALTDTPPTLEILSDVQFHDQDLNAYNILADIPGTDAQAGYVMAGAHLDSWVASDGAADNAAGVSVVMEAARILTSLKVRPRRTIRFALWNAEEQGMRGSAAYVERYVATRAPLTNPAHAKLSPGITWPTRWPITTKAGHRDLVAYFNLDNGSGKIRGIRTEGNVAVVPIFREWLAPFSSMGASTVLNVPIPQSDHVNMLGVGIPGYQFIQDPLDYNSRVHHSSLDSYDHLKAQDMRQNAVILASFLLNAANRDKPLPRMPVPTQPRPSDPFEYPGGN